MSDDMNIKVSALLDHEGDPNELEGGLRALSADAELRRTALRYRMIGDALRGHPLQTEAPQLAERIRESIAREPDILAPAAGRRHRAGPGPTLRLAAGLAIAASVAAIAIAIFPRGQEPALAPATTVALAPGLPRQMPAQSVTARTSSALRTAPPATTGQPTKKSKPVLAWEKYLLDHDEFAARGLARGIRPHASHVAFDGR